MNSQRVTYIPRRDATPEGEIAALASGYAFVRGCAEMRRTTESKKGSPDTAPNDGKEFQSGPATAIILQNG